MTIESTTHFEVDRNKCVSCGHPDITYARGTQKDRKTKIHRFSKGNRKSLRRDIVFHGYIISWFSWFFIFLQLKKSQLQINTYHRCYDQEGYIL